MKKISKIDRVDLRKVWKHEAHDFTTWLQNNIDSLSDVIEYDLINVEREQPAGTFYVDLVAEDEKREAAVIIENQLEKSNHDHLGKLITYLSNVPNTKCAIWIVSEPRPEHTKAIAWLNEATDLDFYLIKLEAIIIDGSSPAPLFTVIVQPDLENKRVILNKKAEGTERGQKRLEYWTELLERAKSQTKLHSNISPGICSYIATGAGKRGFLYSYNVQMYSCSVELYIDQNHMGVDRKLINKFHYDYLYSNKDEIEQTFGQKLTWERLDEKFASRVRFNMGIGGWKSSSEDKIKAMDEQINQMIKLDEAISKHVKSLPDFTDKIAA